MRTYLLNFWDSLRSSFWFVPAVMGVVAVLLGMFMPLLDEVFHDAGYEFYTRVQTTTPAARSTLSAIASATTTMAATVFSITIVTLSLTSSQFGPRLLRTFMLDKPTQWTLGVFVATSLYCLLVLRVVEDVDGSTTPDLSVSLGVVMAVCSLAMLIMFVHHISVMIQAPHVVKTVAGDVDSAIARLYPESIGEAPSEDDCHVDLAQQEMDRLGHPHHQVSATKEGYIQAIDGAGIVNLAKGEGVIVRLIYRPGDFLRDQSTLAELWPEGRLSDDNLEYLRHELNDAYIVGMRRTPRQDLECAVYELVEVAVRALSPGINDPFTAMNCIDSLSASLCRLAQREMPRGYRCDSDGKLRVVIARPTTFANVVDTALDQIRQNGRGNARVTSRMLQGLAAVAEVATREKDREAVKRHADMLLRSGQEAVPEKLDQREIEVQHARVLAALSDADTISRSGGF